MVRRTPRARRRARARACWSSTKRLVPTSRCWCAGDVGSNSSSGAGGGAVGVGVGVAWRGAACIVWASRVGVGVGPVAVGVTTGGVRALGATRACAADAASASSLLVRRRGEPGQRGERVGALLHAVGRAAADREAAGDRRRDRARSHTGQRRRIDAAVVRARSPAPARARRASATCRRRPTGDSAPALAGRSRSSVPACTTRSTTCACASTAGGTGSSAATLSRHSRAARTSRRSARRSRGAAARAAPRAPAASPNA